MEKRSTSLDLMPLLLAFWTEKPVSVTLLAVTSRPSASPFW
jgi:hypothetical protein